MRWRAAWGSMLISFPPPHAAVEHGEPGPHGDEVDGRARRRGLREVSEDVQDAGAAHVRVAAIVARRGLDRLRGDTELAGDLHEQDDPGRVDRPPRLVLPAALRFRQRLAHDLADVLVERLLVGQRERVVVAIGPADQVETGVDALAVPDVLNVHPALPRLVAAPP